MKKLFMGILLPLFAFVSLVGAGFSTWYFENQLSAEGSANISMKVEDYAQIGKFSLTSDVAMSLDQKANGGKGVTLNKELVVTYTHDESYSVPEGDTFEIKVVVTLGEGFEKYIKLKDGQIDGLTYATSDNKTYTFDLTTKLSDGDATFTIPTDAFEYCTKGGELLGEPTNKSEYDAMKLALDGKQISVSATAKIAKA